jgi:hypothetical protein
VRRNIETASAGPRSWSRSGAAGPALQGAVFHEHLSTAGTSNSTVTTHSVYGSDFQRDRPYGKDKGLPDQPNRCITVIEMLRNGESVEDAILHAAQLPYDL